MTRTNNHPARRRDNNARDRRNRHARTNAGVNQRLRDDNRNRGSYYRLAPIPRPQAPANAPTGPRAMLASRITTSGRRDSAHDNDPRPRPPQGRACLQYRMASGSAAPQTPQANRRARANNTDSVFITPEFSETADFPLGAPQQGQLRQSSNGFDSSAVTQNTHASFYARTSTNTRIFTATEMGDIIADPPTSSISQASSSLFCSSQPTQPANIPLPNPPAPPFTPSPRRRSRAATSTTPIRMFNQPSATTEVSKRPANTYKGKDPVKKLVTNDKLRAILSDKPMPKERRVYSTERVELRLGEKSVMK